jgi:colicin import membrane protein
MLGVNQKGVVKMNTELVVVENLDLVPFFTKGDQVKSILDRLTQEAKSFVSGDLSVKKNRDSVKAEVTKFTTSKTYLESKGKELATEYKTIPKTIDANRKLVKDTITDLQVLVRQPLTDWEAEQEAIAAAELAKAEAIKLAKQKEDDKEIAFLLDDNFNREAAAVLAQIEVERIAYENNLRAEAVELAKAEALAETARIAAEYAEKERLANEREMELRAEARYAQQKRIDQEEKYKFDCKEAEEKRLADIEAARVNEVNRQQAEQDRLAAEQQAREDDKFHRASVNNCAVSELMEWASLTQDQAKAVVTSIAKRQISKIAISY